MSAPVQYVQLGKSGLRISVPIVRSSFYSSRPEKVYACLLGRCHELRQPEVGREYPAYRAVNVF